MANLKNVSINTSGFLQIPSGSVNNRPNDASGRFRYNTSAKELESFDIEWANPSKKNNNFVTDELLFFYDALDIRSYPGEGNTWFDISGNGNHASIDTPDIDDLGTFRFINSNGGVQTPTVTTRPNELTMEVTILSTPDQQYSQYDRIIDRDDSTLRQGSANNYGLGLWINAGGSRSTRIDYIRYARDSKWKHVVCAYNGEFVRLYVNGILVGERDKTGDLDSQTGGFTIAGGDNNIWNGRIANAKVYAKGLSESEVIHNFKYHKEQLPLQPNEGSGMTDTDPAPTPRAIRVNNPTATNGYYYVNPKFRGNTVRAFCDVEGSNEGDLGEGWIRVRYASNYYSRNSPWSGTGNSDRSSPPFSVPFSFDIPDADVLTLADNAEIVIQRFETWAAGSVGWTYDNAFQSHEDLKGRLWSSETGQGTHTTQISTMEWNVGYGYNATYDSPDGRGVDPTDNNESDRFRNGTFYFKDTSGDAILPIKRITNSDVDGGTEQRFIPLATGDMGDGTPSNIPSYIFIKIIE